MDKYLRDSLFDNAIFAIGGGVVILFLVFCFWFIFFAIVKFNLWSSSINGEAELRRAEWNRQITVKEAEAKKNAAVFLAEAEVERARGVASANKIIGESLKGNDSYLRYLWIDSLEKTRDQIIYVPTEANLPILESTRNIKIESKNNAKKE